jgi:hypothetical protein
MQKLFTIHYLFADHTDGINSEWSLTRSRLHDRTCSLYDAGFSHFPISFLKREIRSRTLPPPY